MTHRDTPRQQAIEHLRNADAHLIMVGECCLNAGSDPLAWIEATQKYLRLALAALASPQWQEKPFSIPPVLELKHPHSGMREVLEQAIKAIESLDIDALGEGGTSEDSWPLRDELLHRMRDALASPREQQERLR